MPIPTFTKLGPQPEFQDLVNKINTLVGELTNMMLNMDSLNVVELTADHLTAGIIDTNQITITAADGTKYYRINDQGIVANNGTVNTLLFDLATGLMTLTSVLVQSSMGYPKVVLNSGSDLIAAYADADTYLSIQPLGTGSVPAMGLVDAGTTKGFLNRSVGGTTLGTFDAENLNLQAAGNLVMTPTGNLQIGSASGITGTVFVSATNGGPTNTPIVFTKGIRTQ